MVVVCLLTSLNAWPILAATDYQTTRFNTTNVEFGAQLSVFDIPAGAAADAIEHFARQSGIQFLFQSRVLSRLQTQTLIGEMSQRQALLSLLANSGVSAEFVAADIVVLRVKLQHPTVSAGSSIAPTIQMLTEQIVVTARRRAERLHDHPGAVSSFNALALEKARVDGTEDIIHRTANALVEDRPGAEMNVFIRGVGTATNGSATRTDAGIGLYYDGVYTYLAGSRIPLLFFDMQRIEILKGPQGGLYGRNTIGGAIVAQSANPELLSNASMRLELGEYDAHLIDAHVNAPLNKHLFLRASGFYQKRNSYYNNVNPEKTERGNETWAGRLKLRFKPSNKLDAIVSYEHSDEDKGPVIGVPSDNGQRHISLTTTEGRLERKVQRLNSNIAWQVLNKLELRLITGFTRINSEALSDFNNLIHDELSGELQIFEQARTLQAKQYSADLIIKSTTFASALQWLAGISYFEDRLNNTSDAVSGLPTTELERILRNSQSGIRMRSVFLELGYDLSERLSLNTSLRYSSEHRSGQSTDAIDIETNAALLPSADSKRHLKYSKLSPAVSLSFDLNPQVMAFAKITTGYQSGGINTRATSDALTTFGPSSAINYELGLHSEWYQRRLLINASIFQLDQDNFQFQSDNPPLNEFVNTGEARTRGFELDIIAKPAQWLELEAHYGFLDARLQDIPNSTFGDISGLRKFGIPKHTASFGIDIHAPLFQGKADFNLNANYNLVLKRFLGDFEIQLDDYRLLDIRAGITLKNSMHFYLFAENLLNNTHIITPITLQAVEISPPRLIGIGFSIKF